jgi:hypothetical protein
MKKTFSEVGFEKSRKRLSEALANLDKTIKQKLHETVIQSRMINVSSDVDDESQFKVKIVEQAAIIENLNSEINNLQREVENTGIEVEFLNEKNKLIVNKMNDLRHQSSAIAKEIEFDLLKIEELVKSE